jgi:hypothetical protein
MTSVKPFSPEEARKHKISNIPDEVINVVNRLIAKNLSGRTTVSATVKQDDIVNGIIAAIPDCTRETIYSNGWLDFEPIFEGAGWKVVYDKPAYCEDYPATFKFTEK